MGRKRKISAQSKTKSVSASDPTKNKKDTAELTSAVRNEVIAIPHEESAVSRQQPQEEGAAYPAEEMFLSQSDGVGEVGWEWRGEEQDTAELTSAVRNEVIAIPHEESAVSRQQPQEEGAAYPAEEMFLSQSDGVGEVGWEWRGEEQDTAELTSAVRNEVIAIPHEESAVSRQQPQEEGAAYPAEEMFLSQSDGVGEVGWEWRGEEQDTAELTSAVRNEVIAIPHEESAVSRQQPQEEGAAYPAEEMFLSQSDGVGEVGWEWRGEEQDQVVTGKVDLKELVRTFSVSDSADGIPSTPPLLRHWIESPTSDSHHPRQQQRRHGTAATRALARGRIKRGRRGRPSTPQKSAECKELLQKLAALYEQQEQKEESVMSEELETKRSRLSESIGTTGQHGNARTDDVLPKSVASDFSADMCDETQQTGSATSTQVIPASLPDIPCISPITPRNVAKQAIDSPLHESCSSPVIQTTFLSTPVSSARCLRGALRTPKSDRKMNRSSNVSSEDLWTDEELFENDSFLKLTQAFVSDDAAKSPMRPNVAKVTQASRSAAESMTTDVRVTHNNINSNNPTVSCKTSAQPKALFKEPAPVVSVSSKPNLQKSVNMVDVSKYVPTPLNVASDSSRFSATKSAGTVKEVPTAVFTKSSRNSFVVVSSSKKAETGTDKISKPGVTKSQICPQGAKSQPDQVAAMAARSFPAPSASTTAVVSCTFRSVVTSSKTVGSSDGTPSLIKPVVASSKTASRAGTTSSMIRPVKKQIHSSSSISNINQTVHQNSLLKHTTQAFVRDSRKLKSPLKEIRLQDVPLKRGDAALIPVNHNVKLNTTGCSKTVPLDPKVGKDVGQTAQATKYTNSETLCHISARDISFSEELLTTLAEPDDVLDSQACLFDDSVLVSEPSKHTNEDTVSIKVSGPQASAEASTDSCQGRPNLHSKRDDASLSTEDVTDCQMDGDDSLSGDLMATQQLFEMLDKVESTVLTEEKKHCAVVGDVKKQDAAHPSACSIVTMQSQKSNVMLEPVAKVSTVPGQAVCKRWQDKGMPAGNSLEKSMPKRDTTHVMKSSRCSDFTPLPASRERTATSSRNAKRADQRFTENSGGGKTPSTSAPRTSHAVHPVNRANSHSHRANFTPDDGNRENKMRSLQKFPSFDSLNTHASPRTVVKGPLSSSQDSPNRKTSPKRKTSPQCTVDQIEQKRLEALKKRNNRLKLKKYNK